MAYWLFKSEPNNFSIEHLQHCLNQTEPWSGVRNYQARNFMKQMQVGDFGFFYHSNCKAPGIVGVVEIVKTAYPDDTMYHPESIYYDPKSTPDKPRWFMVDVQLHERWEQTLTLTQLRNNQHLTGLLLLARGSRLSVLPVSAPHWEKIIAQHQETFHEKNQ
jgi:predicted RNA-binding protein with PUA-like domain